MTLRKVEAAATLPVTVAEVAANSRISAAEADASEALIEGMIRAALTTAEKWTSKVFLASTYEVVIDAWPTVEIQLPRGPVTSVVSVSYVDADGVTQVMPPTNYEVDTVSADGWVVLGASGSWPTALDRINAIAVRFEVGAEAVEDDIREAILMMVGHWYNQRETAVGAAMTEIPFGAAIILGLNRTMFA